jgi:hypothetical protein
MAPSTKIAVIVREDLLAWQKLNITAFLASGVAAASPAAIGEQYEDGSGNSYLSLFNQPVFVYSANGQRLQRTRARAASRDVPIAIYAVGMFATNNDIDNRAVLKATPDDEIDIAGMAFRADSKTVDKIVSGLRLHS